MGQVQRPSKETLRSVTTALNKLLVITTPGDERPFIAAWGRGEPWALRRGAERIAALRVARRAMAACRAECRAGISGWPATVPATLDIAEKIMDRIAGRWNGEIHD